MRELAVLGPSTLERLAVERRHLLSRDDASDDRSAARDIHGLTIDLDLTDNLAHPLLQLPEANTSDAACRRAAQLVVFLRSP